MGIKRRILVSGFFIFLSISSPLAFSSTAEEQSGRAESIRFEVERDTLKNAMSAFDAGDYNRAKIDFELLSECAQNPGIGRKALFGLASVKLNLARTSEEYEDAISSWTKWAGQPDSSNGCEDPRMITPFLRRLSSSIMWSAGDSITGKDRKTAKEAESRGILSKEKQVQTLQARLELREREIRRLRHQLESLEEIHRKYQEKKQEATL